MVGIPKNASVVLTFIKGSFFDRLLHQITSKYAYSISVHNYDIHGYYYSVQNMNERINSLFNTAG